MRRSLLAAVGAVLGGLACLPRPCAAAAAPSKQELLAKPVKELKAILKSKGLKCRQCSEKDDWAERVLETWDKPYLEVSSPDGTIRMTKAQFIQQLKESYSDRKKDQGGDDLAGHERDDDEDGGAQSLAELLHADIDKIWADFSEKLRAGDVGKDENGRVNYHIDSILGEVPWWQKYKMHGMERKEASLEAVVAVLSSSQSRMSRTR